MTDDKVKVAIELITYDKKYHKAIAKVFGGTFIAEDSETAKKVAMSNTGLRNYNCVTLDGDNYRADGVLSGGANTNKPVLRMIQEYL